MLVYPTCPSKCLAPVRYPVTFLQFILIFVSINKFAVFVSINKFAVFDPLQIIFPFIFLVSINSTGVEYLPEHDSNCTEEMNLELTRIYFLKVKQSCNAILIFLVKLFR